MCSPLRTSRPAPSLLTAPPASGAASGRERVLHGRSRHPPAPHRPRCTRNRVPQVLLERGLTVRWWTPWRWQPRMEWGWPEPPWWAVGTHWHFRHETSSSAVYHRMGVPWWAVDERWARARRARKSCPDPVPWYHPARKWKQRHGLAQARWGQRLPMPWWALDARWSAWREQRKARLEDRRAGKRQAEMPRRGP